MVVLRIDKLSSGRLGMTPSHQHFLAKTEKKIPVKGSFQEFYEAEQNIFTNLSLNFFLYPEIGNDELRISV
jgi:hypothetical protein